MTAIAISEEWRPVSWAPDYEVSSLGRVRSWLRRGGFSKAPAMPRIMATRVNAKRGGYVLVDLQVGGAKVTRGVHRLVLEAFKGPPFAGAEGRAYVFDLQAMGHEPTRLGPPGPVLCSENCGRPRQGNKKRCEECHREWRRALLQQCEARYRERKRAERVAQ
jgi:hypothetical protein